jgi:repressor LexA
MGNNTTAGQLVVRSAEGARAAEMGEGFGAGLAALGDVIRERRHALGLTLQDVAERVECAKSYLSSIETGRRGAPTDEVLARLERALEMEVGALVEAAQWSRTPAAVRRNVRGIVGRLSTEQDAARKSADRLGQILMRSGMDDGGKIRGALDEAYRSGELRKLIEKLTTGEPRGDERDVDEGAKSLSAAGVVSAGVGAATGALLKSRGDVAVMKNLPREVPLINRVAAGYPREFTDLGYPARVADEYVRCPDLDDADAFAARVVGDSMMPVYQEGDVVVFSPARVIKDGMDCFARLEPDDETTFKRVFFQMSEVGEELIRLQPLNAAYPPRVLPRERVAGLYAAVTVMRKIG